MSSPVSKNADSCPRMIEIDRLRRENAEAGQTISEVAKALGCLTSSRPEVLAKIERLKGEGGQGE